MLDTLQDLKPEMEKCFRCSLCKMVPLPTVKDTRYTDCCPANRENGFHAYSTSGKQIMAMALVDGRVQADETMAEIAFACNTCGFGDVACKFIMSAERHEVNMALRNHLVDEGFARQEHLPMIKALTQHGRPQMTPQRAAPWYQGLPVKIAPRASAPVLLLAGCDALHDEATAGVARRFAELLLKAKVDFVILGEEEACCGLPAYWTGHRDLFRSLAHSNTNRITACGAGTVVTLGGSCFGAMRSKYQEVFGSQVALLAGRSGQPVAPAPLPLVHATRFLLDLVESGRLPLTQTVKRTVTYHDPCYLGRQSEPPVRWEGKEEVTLNCMAYQTPPKPINYGTQGEYDSPRALLKRIPGVTFREMFRIREYSYCCGAGGGVPQAYPEMAKATALHRLDEARDAGAAVLVTSCHHCREHLACAQAGEAREPMPVLDIIDLVYAASGLAGEAIQ